MKTRTLFAVTLAFLALPHFLLTVAVNVPALAAIGVAFLALAALAVRVDRWWAVAPGIVAAAVAAVHTFAFYTAFTRFESTPEFTAATSSLTLGVIAVTLGVTDLIARERNHSSTIAPIVVRSFATAVTVLVAVGAASAVVTIASRDTVSASDRENALVIDYKNIAVVNGNQPFTMIAAAGEARIVVDNKDLSFHNFVIKEQGISLDLGPKESKLLTADLEPRHAHVQVHHRRPQRHDRHPHRPVGNVMKTGRTRVANVCRGCPQERVAVLPEAPETCRLRVLALTVG